LSYKKSLKIPEGQSEAVNRRTNNDLQNITQKTKDRVTQTPLKTGDELRYSWRVSSFCSTCDTSLVTILRHEM